MAAFFTNGATNQGVLLLLEQLVQLRGELPSTETSTASCSESSACMAANKRVPGFLIQMLLVYRMVGWAAA